MSTRRAFAVAVAVALVAGGCGGDRERGGPTQPVACAGGSFDTQAWQEARSGSELDYDGERAHALGEQLIACRTLVGNRPAAVERLLGEPMPQLSTKVRWRYPVGDIDDSLDTLYLSVEFEAGKVERVVLGP